MEKNKNLPVPYHPLLKKRAKSIPVSQITSSETQQIIKKMLNFAYKKQKGKKEPVLVGLAAPQIVTSKRIILVDVAAKGKGKSGGDLRIYINQQII
jgi:peptide deformylase